MFHFFFSDHQKSFLYPWHQGTNARKVISEVFTFFVLQCTVFGRKSKHSLLQPDMESIFTKIIYELFWS